MKIKIESERGPTPTTFPPPAEVRRRWRGTILDDRDVIVWISVAHDTCLAAVQDVWARAASMDREL